MWAILRVYLDVVLHRRGPDAIPASLVLFTFTLIANMAINLSVSEVLDEPWLQSIAHLSVYIVMLLSLLWLLLSTLGKSERWLQSATALLGADIIMTAVDGMLYLIGGDLPSPEQTERIPIVVLPLFLSFAWKLAIVSFVVQRAGNLSLLAGIGFAVAYFVLANGLFSLFSG